MTRKHAIVIGDCIKVLKTIPDESVDLVFADPQQTEAYLKEQDIDVVVAFNAFYNEVLAEQETKLEAIKKK